MRLFWTVALAVQHKHPKSRAAGSESCRPFLFFTLRKYPGTSLKSENLHPTIHASHPKHPPLPSFGISTMRLILTCLALIATLVAAKPASAADLPGGGLHILWIDTEGGAATLIVTPAGQSVLIDSGNPGVRDADRIVKVATKIAGLSRIDHLITTHYHIDHYGGAATLSKLIPIERFTTTANSKACPKSLKSPIASSPARNALY